MAVAARIIEAAEHIPTGPPTPWQERAVTVLDTHDCRGVEPPACAVHVYAIGTVAARAARYDRARPLFLRACDLDRNWCARAAQDGSIPGLPPSASASRAAAAAEQGPSASLPPSAPRIWTFLSRLC